MSGVGTDHPPPGPSGQDGAAPEQAGPGTGEDAIDAHVHLWDPARMAYPWLTEVPELAANDYTPIWTALEGTIRGAGAAVDVQIATQRDRREGGRTT